MNAKAKTPYPEEMGFLSVYIPPDLKQWVREQAAAQGVSISKWLVGVLSAARTRAEKRAKG